MAHTIKTALLGLSLAVVANAAFAWTEIDPGNRFVPDEGPGTTLEWSTFDRDGSTEFGSYLTGLVKEMGGKYSLYDLVATICARPENTCSKVGGYLEGVTATQGSYVLPVGFAPVGTAQSQPTPDQQRQVVEADLAEAGKAWMEAQDAARKKVRS